MPSSGSVKEPPPPSTVAGEDSLPASDKRDNHKPWVRVLRVRRSDPMPTEPLAAPAATVVRSGIKVAKKQDGSLQAAWAYKHFHREIEQLLGETRVLAEQSSNSSESVLWEVCVEGLKDCLRTLESIPPVEKSRHRANAILIGINTAAQTYSVAGLAGNEDGLQLVVQAARHLGRAEELLSGLDERRRVAQAPKPRSSGLQPLRDAIAKNPDASTRELALKFGRDEGVVRRLKREFRGRSTGHE